MQHAINVTNVKQPANEADASSASLSQRNYPVKVNGVSIQTKAAPGPQIVDFSYSIVQQLNALCEKREQWEKTDFLKANEGLYVLLSECLDVFEDRFVSGSTEECRTLRSELVTKLASAGIKVQKNTSTLTMFVRVVFASDRKRAHGYAYVLTAAISHNVIAADLPSWIVSAGGIEEIKRLMVKKPEAIARQNAINVAKVTVESELELATIAPLAQVSIAGLAGDYAILLTKPSPDGTAMVIGTLNNVDETLFNLLMVRMAKSLVHNQTGDLQVGTEKQNLMAGPASVSNQAQCRKAA